jgi:hypothetical protein
LAAQPSLEVDKPIRNLGEVWAGDRYNEYLNRRLDHLGFMIGAINQYVTNESDLATWLELDHDIAQAETKSDMHDEAWTTIPLEIKVYEFKKKFNATEADYQAAKVHKISPAHSQGK